MVQASAESGTSEANQGEPLFNVVVKMPPSMTLEDVDRRARAAGIAPERVEALVKALRNLPQIRIGSSVPRSRAEAAREQFSSAGLIVEMTPVLSLTAMTEGVTDGKVQCPACEQRVVLGPHRQCPECEVFVDKITPEDILRRKLMRQERAKLDFQQAREAKDAEKKTRDALEAALREKIREELEEEYGLRQKRSRLTSPPVLAAVALVVAGAAFVGGRGSLGEWPWQKGGATQVATAQQAAADPDKLLESLGSKSAAETPAGGTAVGDPDLDDPLLQQAAGKPGGKKGISVEQAVAASQLLARSVGVGTGAGGATAAAPGSASPASAPAAPADVAPAPVPPTLKTALAFELARQMAEMGQWSRAEKLIASLRTAPRTTNDAALVAAAGAVDVEVRAWALQGVAPGRVRSAADALLTQARAVPGAAEQARVLGAAGAILGRHAALAEEVPRAFLQQGVEAAKRIEAEPQRAGAVSELSLAVGQTLLAEGTRATRAGAWAKAQSASARLEAMVGQATEPGVQARLLAMDSQLKARLGKADPAGESLTRSLEIVERVEDLPQRAVLLQQIARVLDPGATPVANATAALQTVALTRTGVERARTLAELAVLHAQAGLKVKSAEAATAATATEGVPEAEAIALQARLIVRRELAAARVLHDAGRYAESEAVLRRVADFVL